MKINRIGNYVIAVVIVIGSFILFNTILHEYQNLDPQWKHFIPVIGLSGIGIVLFSVKKRPDVNEYLVNAIELLILVIVPTAAAFPLIAVNDQGKIFTGSVVAIIAVIWFVVIVIKKGSTEKEKRDIKDARRAIIVMFISILLMGITSFVTIHELVKLTT